MIKQIIIVGFLVIGIGAAVLATQQSTLLQSFGYDLVDFVFSFHSSEGDAEFNPNLDVFKDGTINVLDVLKDRYEQEANRAGYASRSAVLESSDSAEASGSSI